MTDYKAGSFLFEEISSQGTAWAELIPIVLEQEQAIGDLFDGVEAVVFTGCGTALNVSLTAAPLFQMLTGISASASPAAETYLFPTAALPHGRKILAVLLSRSGKTTEVLRSLEYFQVHGFPTLGITCTADSPLARASHFSLVLSHLAEQAVATTRSVTGMILAAQLITAILSGNTTYLEELQKLPEIFAAHHEEFHGFGKLLGETASQTQYTFVGNGPFYGLARESQYKIRELTLLPADSFPMFDFRHGPQSNVNKEMLITAFLSDTARQQETSLLKDMWSFGGMIWAVCEKADRRLKTYAPHVLELRSDLSDLARLPLYLPAVQYMGYYRALSLGLNPDSPRHLSYWVKIAG
jgi:glucosamine--fructose-6-phosphate aminotransferase (isomerizing)